MRNLIGIFAVALAAVGGLAWMLGNKSGFADGANTCIQCPKFDAARGLKDMLVPTAELVFLHVGSALEHRFEIPPEGAFRQWAARKLRWIFRDRADGRFRYYAGFQFGYDLTDRTKWDLTVSGDSLTFHAPPLALIGCPAVNLGSLAAEIDQRSVFVDEDGALPELQRNLTWAALREGESRLLDQAQRATIKAEVERKLKELLIALSGAMGLKLKPDGIRILYKEETAVKPWPAQESPVGIGKRLAKAHCGPFEPAGK